MAVSNTTRRAHGTRGGAHRRVPIAEFPPLQLNWMPGLPHLDTDGATAVRQFAESTFPAHPPIAGTIALNCSPDEIFSPVLYEDFSPVFYTHDGREFRVASPREILMHAQHLVWRSFHRKGLLIDQPHVVRALLQLRLASHPRAVFALILLSKDLRLLDFIEVFNGTTDHVVVHTREVVREVLKRHAGAVIAARNDPTGEAGITERDLGVARRLREVLMGVEVRLVDYLVVGNTVSSLAERGIV